MERLLEAVSAAACQFSQEKIHAIASQICRTDADKSAAALSRVVGTPAAAEVVERLIAAWQAATVSANELALMLLTASHVFTKAASEQSTELVWTGPTTPFVSARRTEQALLQVINAADQTLFLTSFVAYDVSTIVKSLNAASDRGVAISMLLELSQDQGGSITFDAIGKMKALVPCARLYAWRDKADPFSDGRVHAKVAVADGHICFITSANLTAFAMERNMEAGLLVSGGRVPGALDEHLRALVAMKIVSPV